MRSMFPAVEREKIADRIMKSFTVGPGGLLSVRTDLGSIHVDAGETNEVSVEVLREVEASSPEDAALNLKNLQLSFALNGNDLEIH